MSKNPQSKVDKALAKLSDEQMQKFNNLCKFNANYTTLSHFLEECGHKVSVGNLSTWWINNRPRGKEAIAINSLSEIYAGTEPHNLLEMSAGISAKLVAKLHDLLILEIEKTSASSKLSNIVELLKELRQASTEMQTLKAAGDTKQLTQAGAFQLAENLRKIFKNTPFEQALEAGLKAAIEMEN